MFINSVVLVGNALRTVDSNRTAASVNALLRKHEDACLPAGIVETVEHLMRTGTDEAIATLLRGLSVDLRYHVLKFTRASNTTKYFAMLNPTAALVPHPAKHE